MSAKVQHFFDPDTFTVTYVVFDEITKDAVIIDPVLDYDPASSSFSYGSVNKVLDFVSKNGLHAHYVLDTHAHADHLTGAQEIKKNIPGIQYAIRKEIQIVQDVFKKVFNFKSLHADGSQFDRLLKEGEILEAGSLKIKVLATPGHTPACSSYLIDDMIFVGDVIFMPDYGTGRCDFPAGSAENQFHSIHEVLYKLPNSTRVFVGHDYMPNGRALKFESTIAEEKEHNILLKESTSKQDYVQLRNDRDRGKPAPRLLLPSIQVNIHGGHFPEKEDNGISYLKLPLRSKVQ